MKSKLILIALFAALLVFSMGACDKGKGAEKDDEDTVWTWDRCTTEGWDTTDDTWHVCDSLLYLDVRAACEWEEGEVYKQMYEQDVREWRDNEQHWRGLKKLSPRIKEIYFAYYYNFESSPNLTELPSEIWEIPHMWSVDFRGLPKLKKFPDILVENELERIRIDSIALPLPEGLAKTKLKILEWADSKLDSIPIGLRVVASQMEEISFRNCSLDSLPSWIGEFTSAYHVGFGENQLKTLPEGVKNFLPGIVYLDNNELDSLPDDFCQFEMNLLTIYGNHLCTIDVWPSCYDTTEVLEQIKHQICP